MRAQQVSSHVCQCRCRTWCRLVLQIWHFVFFGVHLHRSIEVLMVSHRSCPSKRQEQASSKPQAFRKGDRQAHACANTREGGSLLPLRQQLVLVQLPAQSVGDMLLERNMQRAKTSVICQRLRAAARAALTCHRSHSCCGHLPSRAPDI